MIVGVERLTKRTSGKRESKMEELDPKKIESKGKMVKCDCPCKVNGLGGGRGNIGRAKEEEGLKERKSRN